MNAARVLTLVATGAAVLVAVLLYQLLQPGVLDGLSSLWDDGDRGWAAAQAWVLVAPLPLLFAAAVVREKPVLWVLVSAVEIAGLGAVAYHLDVVGALTDAESTQLQVSAAACALCTGLAAVAALATRPSH